MKIIENDKIQEKIYIEKLKNGLNVILLPKKSQKKYIIWGVNYGSIDNKFTVDGKKVVLPDGIAHYMEHKLFEQGNGTNSLDTLTSIGVSANAYTTNNHTAYLYEDNNNKFFEALDEFMDYVQNPYFTDENVEKERGIIGQEIMMYDDYPDWRVYMNAMKAMYHKNAVNIDVAGTKETIAKITKELLYETYNSFYVPENMVMVICGDFVPEEIMQEIEKRLTVENSNKIVERIYDEEPMSIVEDRVEDQMDISMPLFIIGYKDTPKSNNQIKKDLAMEIIFGLLVSDSSTLYQELYEKGLLHEEPSMMYENNPTYSHVLIQGQSENYDEVIKKIEDRIEELKNSDISDEEFDRIKKKIYGGYVKSYNDPANIATGILQNYFRNINMLDYFEEFNSLDKEYVKQILNEVFKSEYRVVSVVKPKEKSKE